MSLDPSPTTRPSVRTTGHDPEEPRPETPVSETVVQGGGTASARTEAIAVRTPGAGTNALNLTRKYAVPLCEWLDAEGVTRRRGDVRVLGPRAPG